MVPSLTVTDEDRYSSGGASVPLETFAGRGNYDPIAVVGLSLRFPEDADSVEGFWNMLLEGRCVSQKFPADRMSLSGMHHPDGNRHDTVRLPASLMLISKLINELPDFPRRGPLPERRCHCF